MLIFDKIFNMSLLKSLKWRYATKKFDSNKIISDSNIKKIKIGFNLSASSYGLQPVSLLLVCNKNIQKELVPMSMNQKQIEQASHLAIFCANTKIDSSYIKEFFERIKTIRSVNDAEIDPFRTHLIKSFKSKSNNEIILWATKQAYLAMGNMLALCADLKIDACPMEGFDSKQFDNYFNLKSKGLKSVLIMPLGYRSDDDVFSKMKKVRKSIKDSVIDIF